ncbi:MAG: exonuclease SbcCD subunit D, partial [Candidatus Hodarchaeota archaeon]
MTRILFMSDTHLDVRRPHQVVRQRKIEFQDVFAQIIDYALENEVDLICHSGDLYDLKRPSPVEVQKTIEQLLKLKEKDIKFYVIRGNHDGSADLDDIFGGWSGEYIKTPQLSNVELIDPRYDEARKLDTVGYRDFSNEIRVYGVGYFRQETQEKLKQYIPLESVDSSRYNILLMHGF